MTRAYVDTSCYVAVLLNEPGAGAIAKRLARLDLVCASPLVEAELLAAALREKIEVPEGTFLTVQWLMPPQRLTFELQRVLAAGYLRGADAWHVATALHFFPEPGEAFFLTLDSAQRAVAQKLGFVTEWSELGS